MKTRKGQVVLPQGRTLRKRSLIYGLPVIVIVSAHSIEVAGRTFEHKDTLKTSFKLWWKGESWKGKYRVGSPLLPRLISYCAKNKLRLLVDGESTASEPSESEFDYESDYEQQTIKHKSVKGGGLATSRFHTSCGNYSIRVCKLNRSSLQRKVRNGKNFKRCLEPIHLTRKPAKNNNTFYLLSRKNSKQVTKISSQNVPQVQANRPWLIGCHWCLIPQSIFLLR